MKKRKIIAILLILAMALPLVAACGCEEEIRYTITEEEWDAYQSGESLKNVTVKTEQYYAGESNTQVTKNVDGFACSCDGDKWWEEHATESASSGSSSHMSVTVDTSGLQFDTEDSVSSVNSGVGMRTVEANMEDSVSSVDSDVDMSTGEVDTEDGELGEVVIFTTITPSWEVDYEVSVPKYEINMDWLYPNGTYYGTWVDSAGKEYTYAGSEFVGSGCTMTYNGKEYTEIPVVDENGDESIKWAEPKNSYTVNKFEEKIPFSDLAYDETERAYVYSMSHSEDEYSYNAKTYFYFENGKLVKSVNFWTDNMNFAEKEFDLTNVKPNQLVSDYYYSFVSRYYNYGETEIEHHSFSKNDIVTKVKKD